MRLACRVCSVFLFFIRSYGILHTNLSLNEGGKT